MGTKKADFKLNLSFDYEFSIGGNPTTDPEFEEFIEFLTNDPDGNKILNALAVKLALIDIGTRHSLINSQEWRSEAIQMMIYSLYINAMNLTRPSMRGQFLTDLAAGKGTDLLEERLGWGLIPQNNGNFDVRIDERNFQLEFSTEELPVVIAAPQTLAAVLDVHNGILIVINVGLERQDPEKFPISGNLMTQAIVNIETARELLDLRFQNKVVRFNLFENDPAIISGVEGSIRKFFADYYPTTKLEFHSYDGVSSG